MIAARSGCHLALIYNKAATMARDQAYYEAEKKTQIMIETNKGGKHAP
jgi:hypothetical protein